LIYWQSGDWIGIGPGAHGRVTHNGARIALEAQRRPGDYIDAVRENGIGLIEETTLGAEEYADEMLLMGLRVAEGVNITPIETLRARPLNRDAMAWLEQQSLIARDGARIRLTRQGRALANRIVAELAS
jgi:oxygen-independent coproporphyrinogen-3 oxidase